MVKHAQASQAFVYLHRAPDRVTLNIRDDGRAFDPGEVMLDHLGLGIMRERAEGMGARFDIFGQVGQRTMVTVDWREADEGHSHD